MQNTKLRSFINGLLMPVPMLKRLDRQVMLEVPHKQETTCIRLFALGHMVSSVPILVSCLVMSYQLIDHFKLYTLL